MLLRPFSALTFALSLLASFTSVLSVPLPQNVTGDTTVHDPSMCKDSAGKYWLFRSDPVGVSGLDIRTSTDRVKWTTIGKVWPNGASWTDPYTNRQNGPLWAPDCTYINGKFYLYYSASTSGSRHSAIFLATSTTGQPGSWQNKGLVLSTTDSDDHNAIDANMVVDGSNWWLSFGSFWTGIKLIQLDTSSGLVKSGASLYSLAKRTANNGALEGSNVFKQDSFYYLLASWDNCCQGTSSTYNIRVGRSSQITGPYVDQAGVQLMNGGGTLVLGSHDNIIGPGGQDVLLDKEGWILIYHWYTSANSWLGINELDFSSGWPVVK